MISTLYRTYHWVLGQALPGLPDASGTATATDPGAPDLGLLEFFDPGALPGALLVVLIALGLVRLSRRGLTMLSKRFEAHRLTIIQTSTFVAFGIYGTMTLIVLAMLFEFSSEAIFALSGGAAVTVGFALKDVASSFLASLTVLASKPFQVGDRVAFGGYYGEITDIGLRSVRMVTLDDNQVTIPSNKFLTEPVASANAGALDCMVVIPFYLDAECDLARTKSIVQDAVLASPYLYLGKPFSVLSSIAMSSEGNAHIVLHAKAYVYDARHEKDFASDVTEQVLFKFKEEGHHLASQGGR